jgi:hypothetical protein
VDPDGARQFSMLYDPSPDGARQFSMLNDLSPY